MGFVTAWSCVWARGDLDGRIDGEPTGEVGTGGDGRGALLSEVAGGASDDTVPSVPCSMSSIKDVDEIMGWRGDEGTEDGDGAGGGDEDGEHGWEREQAVLCSAVPSCESPREACAISESAPPPREVLRSRGAGQLLPLDIIILWGMGIGAVVGGSGTVIHSPIYYLNSNGSDVASLPRRAMLGALPDLPCALDNRYMKLYRLHRAATWTRYNRTPKSSCVGESTEAPVQTSPFLRHLVRVPAPN